MVSSNLYRAFVAMSIVTLITGCLGAPTPTAMSRTARTARALTAEASLYPLEAGLRWDYVLRQRQADGSIKERPMAMGVASAAAVGPGETEAVLERRYAGWAPPATRARATAAQVVLSRLADPPDGPSLTILRLPAEPASQWPGRPLTGGHRETVVVRGEERIEVPAGRYQAVHVVHELRYANGDGDDLEYWYAPGAGCVRMIERTTIYMGEQPMKLAVEGVLTALTPGGWKPEAPRRDPAEPFIGLMPERVR